MAIAKQRPAQQEVTKEAPEIAKLKEKLKEQEILELKDPLERSKVKNSFLKVGVTSATPTTPPDAKS